MSDHRARPRIHRTDDAHDAKIRAYAREHGIEPWQVLEQMIDGAELTPRDEELRAARAEIERLTAEVSAERGRVIDMNGERNEYERAARRCADELRNARKVADDLRAELAQAREATRRAEEQLARARGPMAQIDPAAIAAAFRERGVDRDVPLAEVIKQGISRVTALENAKRKGP